MIIHHAHAAFVRLSGPISINLLRTFRLYLFLLTMFTSLLSQPYRSLLKPCIRDRILAPTQGQRLSYKSWLHVYAKDTSAITPRMARLIDLYKVIEISSGFSF